MNEATRERLHRLALTDASMYTEDQALMARFN